MRLIDADRLLKDMKICCERNCMKCRNATFLASDEHCGLIDDQPTANEWIPCSERLPEKREYCVTTTVAFIPWTRKLEVEVGPDVFTDDGTWVSENDENVAVAAWMPIPAKYEPTQDELRKLKKKINKSREEKIKKERSTY